MCLIFFSLVSLGTVMTADYSSLAERDVVVNKHEQDLDKRYEAMEAVAVLGRSSSGNAVEVVYASERR